MIKIMRKIFLTILVITFIIPVFSQNDCVIQLRNAQKLYEDGILEEIQTEKIRSHYLVT